MIAATNTPADEMLECDKRRKRLEALQASMAMFSPTLDLGVNKAAKAAARDDKRAGGRTTDAGSGGKGGAKGAKGDVEPVRKEKPPATKQLSFQELMAQAATIDLKSSLRDPPPAKQQQQQQQQHSNIQKGGSGDAKSGGSRAERRKDHDASAPVSGSKSAGGGRVSVPADRPSEKPSARRGEDYDRGSHRSVSASTPSSNPKIKSTPSSKESSSASSSASKPINTNDSQPRSDGRRVTLASTGVKLKRGELPVGLFAVQRKVRDRTTVEDGMEESRKRKLGIAAANDDSLKQNHASSSSSSLLSSRGGVPVSASQSSSSSRSAVLASSSQSSLSSKSAVPPSSTHSQKKSHPEPQRADDVGRPKNAKSAVADVVSSSAKSKRKGAPDADADDRGGSGDRKKRHRESAPPISLKRLKDEDLADEDFVEKNRSSIIWSLMGVNRNRYRDFDDDEDDDMEVDFRAVSKEESRSAKIARQEDEREEKAEAERKKKKQLR